MLVRLFKLSILLFFLNLANLAKAQISIEFIIEDKIITNYDIIKEVEYLKILNPNLQQIDTDQIIKLAKSSLVNEIIKKKEIEKFLDYEKKLSYFNDYLTNFYLSLNYKNEEDFFSTLQKKKTYSPEQFKNKIKTELLWNELIYLRFNNLVKIDKIKLENKLNNLKKQYYKEYQLSEILFTTNKDNQNLKKLIDQINTSIKNVGFTNTATIFSISDTSKLGGRIGWVNENSLSEQIFDKIKDLNKSDISDIIKIGNKYLILRVEDIREIKKEYDLTNELKKIEQEERNRQLGIYSIIFFDKVKLNYSINEK